MVRIICRALGGVIVWLLLAGNSWGDEPVTQGYGADPALSGKSQPVVIPGKGESLAVDASEVEGGVRLSAKTPVSPYVEAVGGKAPTADELRLLPDAIRRNPFELYQLGAGIGIAVEDNTSISLGYRLHQPMSLLDDSRQASGRQRDDLRVFFDVKLPFD